MPNAQRARLSEPEIEILKVGKRRYVRDHRGLLIPIPAGAEEGGKEGEGEGGTSGAGETEPKAGESGEGGDKDVIPRKEYDAVSERMRAADRRASQFEDELKELRQFKKEIEDANKSETDKLKTDLKEATTKAEAAEERARTAELKLAIVVANSKRERPFRNEDLEDVLERAARAELSEDGSLDDKRLKKFFDELADAKPHWLVSAPSEGEGELTASGRSLNGDKNKGKGADVEALKKKYPMLRR